MIIREVVAGHDVVALSALNEQVPEFGSRQALGQEFLNVAFEFPELFRILPAEHCVRQSILKHSLVRRHEARTMSRSAKAGIGFITQDLDLAKACHLDSLCSVACGEVQRIHAQNRLL